MVKVAESVRWKSVDLSVLSQIAKILSGQTDRSDCDFFIDQNSSFEKKIWKSQKKEVSMDDPDYDPLEDPNIVFDSISFHPSVEETCFKLDQEWF